MARELGIPAKPGQAGEAILRFDGFEVVESDRRDAERDQALVIGQFLIDRDGIVRWINVERRPGELLSDARLASAMNALGLALALVMGMKTPEALGLTIPPSVLVRADEAIR